jgi:hypothetical protein
LCEKVFGGIMGITQAELIQETLQIMELPLKELGYQYSIKKFEHWDFGFYKRSSKFNLYLHIDFQPSGFDLDDIFDLAVNLIRNTKRDLHTLPPPIHRNEPVVRFSNRLSPILYKSGRREGDHWWHFTTIEEARSELNDIYQKLVKFGIPYLEDPNNYDFKFIRY